MNPPTAMSSPVERELREELERWERAGLRRTTVDEEAVEAQLDFCSNDYLGLSLRPEVVEAAREALARWGVGSRGARLLAGGHPLQAALEREAADWLGSEAALLFPSGWQANLGVLTTLAGRGDAIFSDALNHASLIDGARLSRARVHVYRHGDLEELERQLERERGAQRRLVVSDAVFSMDGDPAPLGELQELCARHDAWLVLDEAHSAGWLGPEGAGAWAAADPAPAGESRLVARVVTAGKALGASGALAVGGAELRELLVQRARPFVFTTAPSPAVPAALSAAIAIVRSEPELRAQPLARAVELTRRLGLPAARSPIVPLVIGDEARALELAETVRERGYDVRAVRPPTVPPGTARLRLVCHAANGPEEVLGLAQAICEAWDFRTPAAAPQVGAPAARALAVVGTDTGVGKTVVSALLLAAARRLGKARYWKPCQTGEDSDTRTVIELAAATPDEILPPTVELPLAASPHQAAAAAGVEIDPEQLRDRLAELRREHTGACVLFELAGGLLVPYRIDATQADWLERDHLPLVLVARSGLGTLNHTLLTLEALRARHLEARALFLVGPPHPANRATLEQLAAVERIFEVPQFEALNAETLEGWLAENDLGPVLE